MQKLFLTDVDQVILDLLTWRTRIATSTQVVRLLACTQQTSSRIEPRFKNLIRAGLIERAKAVVALPRIDGPLFSWSPGNDEPDCNALAWHLERRWRSATSRRLTVYWATRRAVHLVGGIGGRLRQPLQMQHDLGTTAVLLCRTQTDPSTVERWLSEDIFRLHFRDAKGGKVPDAVLCAEDGTIVVAIEFGGLYSSERLRRFHRHFARKSLDYELW